VKARSRHLLDDIKYYRTETENSLEEIRQDFSQIREEWNSEQATWQKTSKAGREMDEVNDSVRLVEERLPD
jgi:chromosome segregation ATPase